MPSNLQVKPIYLSTLLLLKNVGYQSIIKGKRERPKEPSSYNFFFFNFLILIFGQGFKRQLSAYQCYSVWVIQGFRQEYSPCVVIAKLESNIMEKKIKEAGFVLVFTA